MSFRLGLTGSIGMGKSTTAQMFADAGCAVWDADAAVHRMYAPGGAAVAAIRAALPEAIVDKAVSRQRLKEMIARDGSVLRVLEQIVHPLVASDRAEFAGSTDAEIVVFDIPLLFEGGGDAAMDAVVCVSVSPEEQERRVMERGTMTVEQFHQIRAKQMPNAEKCARSDYVVITDRPEHARAQVNRIVELIKRQIRDA